MNKLFYIIFGIALVFFSCSSDPCENVNCVNGSCVDGICDCIGDFVGPTCSQLPCENGTFANGSCECDNGYYGNLCENNFFGLYHAAMVNPLECGPEFPIQNPITNLDNEQRLCNLNDDGTQLSTMLNRNQKQS